MVEGRGSGFEGRGQKVKYRGAGRGSWVGARRSVAVCVCVCVGVFSPQVHFAHTIRNSAYYYIAKIVIVDVCNYVKHVARVQILVTTRQVFVSPIAGFISSEFVGETPMIHCWNKV